MGLWDIYLTNEDIILQFLSYWMIFVGFITLCSLLKKDAPYGRYTNYKYGKPVSARLSWFIMELPPFLITASFYILNMCGYIKLNYVLILYSIHYTYRSLIYSYLIRDGKPLPFMTSFLAFVFNVYNGIMQSLACVSLTVEFNLITYLGIIGFFFGLLVNIISDHQLRMLRSHSNTDGQRYKIPRGILFEYVSCANYFGEIFEWWCFALVTRSSSALAFSIFTCCNLVPRALSHHRWYHEKFENYPRNRKAIIPWIL